MLYKLGKEMKAEKNKNNPNLSLNMPIVNKLKLVVERFLPLV